MRNRKTRPVEDLRVSTIRIKNVRTKHYKAFKIWCKERGMCMTAVLRHFIRHHNTFTRKVKGKNRLRPVSEEIGKLGKIITSLRKERRTLRATLKRYGLS